MPDNGKSPSAAGPRVLHIGYIIKPIFGICHSTLSGHLNLACFYNPMDFHAFLNNLDWSVVLERDNVDAAVAVFTDTFNRAIDLFAPYKWITCRGKSADWITNDFLSLVDTKHY